MTKPTKAVDVCASPAGKILAPSLPTLTPVEFGVLLDLAVNASVPVGRVLQLGDLFARASALANQQDRIGALPAPAVVPEGP